jgi:hypothetical protein
LREPEFVAQARRHAQSRVQIPCLWRAGSNGPGASSFLLISGDQPMKSARHSDKKSRAASVM